ncbi:uncharacterized protein C16orf46 homolog isoform X1 [Takifugu rubripes]|uniref:uncharacterized protein C16orf46 homolog isoform X1 n=1 Tax=Takifugu rubripes TaxID=31033 RepID=UPI0011460BB9|nr:uncharacterized protein C16orf46 homolog isoform X1 [Takifugu rubripes]
MAAVEAGETTVRGSEELPAAEEEAEQLYESPGRRHVDALLDISEEELLRDLEPLEYCCSSSWDEAVRGWARAAPLSCVLVTQNCKKPKQKECAEPPLPNAEGSASNNTPDQLNQHAGCRRRASSTGPVQSEASPPPVIRAVQKSPADLGQAPVKTRPAKIQRPSHTTNTVVPIRHFTFLPPIVYPHLRRPIPGSGAKAPDDRVAEDASLIFDRKSRMRGRAGALHPEPPAGVRQNSPCLFRAISGSAHNRYLMAGGSTPSQRRRLPGKNDLPFGGAAARENPSKTVCAVNL